MTKLKQYLTSRKHEFPLPLLPKKQHLWKVVFKCLVSKWLVTRGRSVRSIPGNFACGLLSWFRKDKKVVSLVIGNVTTDLSSLPFCLYCCFPLVLNLLAAIFRFHFCRQTGLKPGCSVTHFRKHWLKCLTAHDRFLGTLCTLLFPYSNNIHWCSEPRRHCSFHTQFYGVSHFSLQIHSTQSNMQINEPKGALPWCKNPWNSQMM